MSPRESESAVEGAASVDRALSAFRPDSVTVLGASPRVRASAIIVENLVRGEAAFLGGVSLVSRREKEMFGYPCVASVAEVEAPGLVFCMASLGNVVDSLDAFTTPPAGLLLYSESKTALDADALTSIAFWTERNGCTLIGPQSAGFVAPGTNLMGWTGALPERLRGGRLGLVSQSGGILSGILRSCGQLGLGISAALSVGTGYRTDSVTAGLSILKLPETGVLGVYAEAIDPYAVAALGSMGAELGKPVVVLSAGRSLRAREAALSHVGQAATPHHLLDAIARQYGITLVQDVDELVWALDALVETGCPRGFPAGIVTISTSGGVAVCATDALDAVGAPVAPLEDSTIERLAGLGGGQTIFNPFDMGAYGIGEPGGRYEELLQALGDDRTVGVVLELSGTGSNVVDPRVNSDGNEANGFLSEPTVLGSIISGCGKVAILSSPASLGHGRSSWRDGLLRIAGARRTAVVANALTRWSSSLKLIEDPPSLTTGQAFAHARAARTADTANRIDQILIGERAKQALSEIPVSWPRDRRLDTDADLSWAASQLGWPIVLKAEVEVAHRAGVGAVLVNINTDGAPGGGRKVSAGETRCGGGRL